MAFFSKENKLKFNKFTIFVCIAIFALFVGNLTAKDTQTIDKNTQSLAKLTKVIGIVEKTYVDKLEFSEIIDKTIAGLLSNLDAHSNYLDEKGFEDMKVQTSGEFGGLGITVGMKDGALTIIAPIDDTPASKAGIKSGDVILMIDGNSTIGISLDEAVKKMRGKPKTDVKLTIVRKNTPKPIDFTITRDIIKVDSVSAKMIEDENILYLRVSSFDQNVKKKASEFIRKHQKVKGIILDLRNNPGGLLNQAVELTNLFINKGIIVSQKARNSEDNIEFSAKAKAQITNLPLVVIVNGGSASASEIVAGALQDHKRAVIIGEKTFGKGSVQMVIPVDKKEALRLTIARYYLPSGRTIQAVGITPDIVVHPGKVPQNEFEFSIKESDLKQHLQSEIDKIKEPKNAENARNDKKIDSKNIISKKDILEDIQLKSAIDSVKILNIK